MLRKAMLPILVSFVFLVWLDVNVDVDVDADVNIYVNIQ